MKSEDKQIIRAEKTMYKSVTIVADETSSIKLVLWENVIDLVQLGKSYHFQNCKIRVFDDCKFINTNEFTIISEIDNIGAANLNTPDLQDNLITGTCLGFDVKKNRSCTFCNKTIHDSQSSGTTVKCQNCDVTMLTTSLSTKMVCHVNVKIDTQISHYTAFNDAMQSFCKNMGFEIPAIEIDAEELTLAILNAGQQKLLVDNSTKVIYQFLP